MTAVPPRNLDIGAALQEALALQRQGRLRDAEKLFARVLKTAPDNFDALHLLGLVKAQQGQMGEAHRLMAAAVRVHPGFADAWLNLANVLHALRRDADALAALDKALALRPGDPEILRHRGNALLALGRAAEAVDAFDRSINAQPRSADTLMSRGTALASLGRAAEALADFNAALALAPAHPVALYNRGTALLDLGRATEALADFDRALTAMPDDAKAWNNRGRALQALNRHQEAVESFGKAIALRKDYADAHSNRAMSLLTLGDFRQGFADYEWRWKRSGMSDARRNYRGPLWLGEYPPARKRLLLWAEQGLGDTIQFARYASLLASMGATVLLEVQPELKPLLRGLAGVTSLHARGEPLPAYDMHCPLGSLPLALKTEPQAVPADSPYVHADASRVDKWRPRVDSLPGRRVAIAWAGHARHANDRNRSIDLALLAPLFACEGISFISVQRDLRNGDAERLARHGNVAAFGPSLDDMADTAAVLALCDLLIAVDTSVVHLAGAMARPAWVMLPFSPDWRWTLQDERSPWYPQLRLFRQSMPGDWPGLVARVIEALKATSTMTDLGLSR